MLTIEELYKKVVISSQTKEIDEDLVKLQYDPYHLECVFDPSLEKKPWLLGNDKCKTDFITCLFMNLEQKEDGSYLFKSNGELCKSCIDVDKINKLIQSKDIMKVLKEIKEHKRPVYAAIAPAFLSQFDIVSDGQLRSAFKLIGFAGMVEVSLFADILTLKEGLEFEHNINNPEDFLLTSCCCPMWVGMIKNKHPELLTHVPKAVSPMVASGRVIKKLIPDAFTVFVGPCLAKKIEAKEADINDAIDVVLTFQETKDIFECAKIVERNLPIDLREHSSVGGRRYAITSGVSYAVKSTVERLNPDKKIKLVATQANGIAECKVLIKDLEEGKIKSNFLEGMGCVGGCVGGPRSLINHEVATKKVEEYSDKSIYKTPIDNPYVIELLHRIGIDTIEDLLEDNEIFTRYF